MKPWWPLLRVCMEPPFRLIAKALLRVLPVGVRTRALWGLSARPGYLLGVLTAADEAKRQGVPEISVVEFGVAGGFGLVTLQKEAEAVEKATGVRIKVYGFDMGPGGLPSFIGDYRDHPDQWRPGDFPMVNEQALRARLNGRTTLILGDVGRTVPGFFAEQNAPPLGFISIDLDIYSSTRDALKIFSLSDKRMLWHTIVYLDDIEFFTNHRFAGELLAVEEFNADNSDVKIDKWYGITDNRPFPEKYWYQKMYVAHDLKAISKARLTREAGNLPLR